MESDYMRCIISLPDVCLSWRCDILKSSFKDMKTRGDIAKIILIKLKNELKLTFGDIHVYTCNNIWDKKLPIVTELTKFPFITIDDLKETKVVGRRLNTEIFLENDKLLDQFHDVIGMIYVEVFSINKCK